MRCPVLEGSTTLLPVLPQIIDGNASDRAPKFLFHFLYQETIFSQRSFTQPSGHAVRIKSLARFRQGHAESLFLAIVLPFADDPQRGFPVPRLQGFPYQLTPDSSIHPNGAFALPLPHRFQFALFRVPSIRRQHCSNYVHRGMEACKRQKTQEFEKWRRGESNPRPKSATARRLHAYRIRFVSPAALGTRKTRRRLVRLVLAGQPRTEIFRPAYCVTPLTEPVDKARGNGLPRFF